MSSSSRSALVVCFGLAILGLGCPSGSSPPAPEKPQPAPQSQKSEATKDYNLDIPMVKYSWDPNAGDSSVSAEDGGPGFTGEGWTTNMEFPAMGSPEAVKGGFVRMYIPDWPPTLRQMGKDWNASIAYRVADICYQSLLNVHPTTLEYIPNIASHWYVAPDKMTYRFRINPSARFSNGEEVTAHDVVATMKLMMDPTLLEPSNILTFGKLETPVAKSKYIVEVKVKQENWRNLLYFGQFTVHPASQVGSITGKEYLEKYQFSYTASSGPYIVKPEGIDQGKSITISRRTDWWDKDNPAWVGLYNLDEYRFEIIKDSQLAYEKSKRLELDYFLIPKAQWYVEELPQNENVKRGLLVRKKFYADYPKGIVGFAINMQVEDLKDVRMRLALAKLLDRETMLKKLYFDEYVPMASYFPGGTYQNPANKPVEYDEFGAVELLQQLGWTELDSEGYRTKDGRRLKFTVNYRSKLSERSLTIFQEACKRAGIEISLQYLTSAAAWKNMREKEYELNFTNWGALVFPNPETSWHSRLASQKDNNNVTSFANPRADELFKEYDEEYDINRRIEIVREIDALLFAEHPYVLAWYNPAHRRVLTNKFSWPEWGVNRTDQESYLLKNWWVDPAKEKALNEAIADPTMVLDPGVHENRFWEAWNAKRNAAVAK